MTILKDKQQMFERLAGKVSFADHRIVNDIDSFTAACDELLDKHPTVCFKPITGRAGRGFRIVSPHGEFYDGPVNCRDAPMNPGEARKYLECAGDEFAPQMVMEYLTGPERSIDCLAENGKLLGAVIRVKYHNRRAELL